MRKRNYLVLGVVGALLASAAYVLKVRPVPETEPESTVVKDALEDMLNDAPDKDTAVALLFELKETAEAMLNDLKNK